MGNRATGLSANLADNLAALKPMEAPRTTDQGDRFGFFMEDATRALGGLKTASDTLVELMLEGVLESEPVFVGGNLQTLYRIMVTGTPTLH